MTRVKICGLRDVESAIAAAEAGADFLGFVFVPGAWRRLSVGEARRIVGGLRDRLGVSLPPTVGLFQDQPAEEVNAVAKSCELDMVQLCGQEPPEYWQEMTKPVLKVVKVRAGQMLDSLGQALDDIFSRGHLPVLDAFAQGVPGGAGVGFDWSIARRLAPGRRFLMAGGLTPGNVGEAIRTASPWGVDVSSGVESGDRKDLEKIRAFVRNAKAPLSA